MGNYKNNVQDDIGYRSPDNHGRDSERYPNAKTVTQRSKQICPTESPLKEWWKKEQSKEKC
jgi:hypothetical protein